MWRSDPQDLLITGVLFVLLVLATWSAQWVASVLVAVCILLRRAYRTRGNAR